MKYCKYCKIMFKFGISIDVKHNVKQIVSYINKGTEYITLTDIENKQTLVNVKEIAFIRELTQEDVDRMLQVYKNLKKSMNNLNKLQEDFDNEDFENMFKPKKKKNKTND